MPSGLDVHALERAQLLQHHVAVVLDPEPQALDGALDAGERALGGGHRDRRPGTRSSAPARSSSPRRAARGAIVQPMRKPVIPYSFETPLTTITVDSSTSRSVNAYADGGADAVEDEPVVDVVHDQVDAALLAERDEALDQLGRVDRARRVVRAVARSAPSCTSRTPPPPRRAAGTKPPSSGVTITGLAVHHPHHLRVADPVRREDHDLVLRVDEREQRVVDRLLRARGDDHVLRRDDPAVVLLGVADDRLLQRRRAVGRGRT